MYDKKQDPDPDTKQTEQQDPDTVLDPEKIIPDPQHCPPPPPSGSTAETSTTKRSAPVLTMPAHRAPNQLITTGAPYTEP